MLFFQLIFFATTLAGEPETTTLEKIIPSATEFFSKIVSSPI